MTAIVLFLLFQAACSAHEGSTHPEVFRSPSDPEHPQGRIWPLVPLQRRGALVYMELERKFPEKSVRLGYYCDPARPDSPACDDISRPGPRPVHVPRRATMVELLVNVADSSLVAESDKGMGSWIETWKIDCSRRTGAYAAVAGYAGQMAQGASLGVGDNFPTEDDYKATPEVELIFDVLSRQLAPAGNPGGNGRP